MSTRETPPRVAPARPPLAPSPDGSPQVPAAGLSPALGVLGGSGLYDLEGLEGRTEEVLDTPFGAPSGPLVTGLIDGVRVVFLARHGRDHRLGPSEINSRANIHALKQLGVRRLLSVSAVGSLREGIPPGHLVLVDQLIDRTYLRHKTFFEGGVVGHVSFAEPTCPQLDDAVAAVAASRGHPLASREARNHPPSSSSSPSSASPPPLHRGGTYVCMEGPQFSTRAESHLHRGWGADVIGMTAAPEAKLAREAEMCFSLLALSTDYDCWRTDEAAVTAESVVAVLRANVARASHIVRDLAPYAATRAWSCDCGRAAERAILTAREGISPEARARLHLLYGRYL
jgi:5'-methylthioadenosine phosphorylase